MKAASDFKYGDGERTHFFKAGDEIPAKIVKDIPESLIFEKVLKNNPESLTKEQLLLLAGVDTDTLEPEEVNEEQFREGMKELTTKRDLMTWAREFFGLDLPESMTRAEMEDAIVSSQFGEETEEEEEE